MVEGRWACLKGFTGPCGDHLGCGVSKCQILWAGWGRERQRTKEERWWGGGRGGDRPRLLSWAGLRICEVEEVLFLLAGVLGSARGGRLPPRSLVSPEEAGHSCLFPDHFYICLVWAPWWGSWASLCPHMLCPHMRAPEPSGPLIVPWPHPPPPCSEGWGNWKGEAGGLPCQMCAHLFFINKKLEKKKCS